MHRAREGGRTCVIRTACHESDPALLSFFTVAGVPAAPAAAAPPAATATRVPALTVDPISSDDIPESPPPRV